MMRCIAVDDESLALDLLEDNIRKMIADRIPFGVVEMKSAWVTDERNRNRRLTATLARAGCSNSHWVARARDSGGGSQTSVRW